MIFVGKLCHTTDMHERAGQPALSEDLINVEEVRQAYYDLVPDPAVPAQRVVFGTSGHRGSSLDTAFNEAHIVATTAAIVEYRASQGTDGVLYLGRDTHALSLPAWRSAVEVLVGAGVKVAIDSRDSYTPTPAVSHSILVANGAGTPEGVRTSGPGLADGIVVTPSQTLRAMVVSSTTRPPVALPAPTPLVGLLTAPTNY